ncbi:hypothetical protein M8J76_013323 [Diaphorina citri]|nr:hypothetical protein M8J75_003657 [Diaphorina citri]KAI5719679.1 hypothetical protein M8J76_013323 [Diaphorina citri]
MTHQSSRPNWDEQYNPSLKYPSQKPLPTWYYAIDSEYYGVRDIFTPEAQMTICGDLVRCDAHPKIQGYEVNQPIRRGK